MLGTDLCEVTHALPHQRAVEPKIMQRKNMEYVIWTHTTSGYLYVVSREHKTLIRDVHGRDSQCCADLVFVFPTTCVN